MKQVKPNMDCENCWLIVNEFDSDYACDECVADATDNDQPEAGQ